MTLDSQKRSWLLGFLTCLALCVIFQTFNMQSNAQTKSKKDAFSVYSLNLPKEVMEKIKLANDALIAAMEALKNEGKYSSTSDIPNATLILSGGGNSLQDLENGLGIDPESYCLLYANLASPEIIDKLSKDDQGRLLYNNKVVRMLSPERMKEIGIKRKAFQDFNQYSSAP